MKKQNPNYTEYCDRLTDLLAEAEDKSIAVAALASDPIAARLFLLATQTLSSLRNSVRTAAELEDK